VSDLSREVSIVLYEETTKNPARPRSVTGHADSFLLYDSRLDRAQPFVDDAAR
jgi:hypothetical protein